MTTQAITRRSFLRNSAITAIGLGLSGSAFRSTAWAQTPSDKIVVLVNLFGGNDFLNTVIPLGQFDRYRNLRPMLHIPADRAIALPDRPDIGLNPGLASLGNLYAQGKVAAVVGTGAPQDAQGLFDHEASQLNLQSGGISGSGFTGVPSGWIGRWLDSITPGAAPAGVNIGGYASLTLAGESRDALTVYSLDSFGVFPTFDSEARYAAYQRIQNVSSLDSREPAARGRSLRNQVISLGDTFRQQTANYVPAAAYPEQNGLADALRQCATLIHSGLGVRALAVGADGFDTHAAQNDGASQTELGYHDYLLMTVGDAIAAFHADLAGHGHAGQVVTVVVSEFGRRALENTDIGTDHGFAGGMFVVGDSVHGGVYGDYPSLADSQLVFDGNIDVTTDFRSVYATVLANHLGADPEQILGGSFPTLGFL